MFKVEDNTLAQIITESADELKDVDEILALVDRDRIDDRAEITEEALSQHSRGFIEALSGHLEIERAMIALNASKWADYYWDANYAAQEGNDKSQYCYIGTRVRVINDSASMEWFRNRSLPNTSNSNKRKVISTYIPKGKSHRYSRKLFTREPGWAVETINYVEDHYALCRKRNTVLSEMRRCLREYKQIIDQYDELVAKGLE